MTDKTLIERPPANTQRITRWRDLPNTREPARYKVASPDGDVHRATLSKNARCVLEGLRQGPMLCASPVRLSDVVLVLKRDHGINIETKYFENDGATDRARFGVYFLVDDVQAVVREVAA